MTYAVLDADGLKKYFKSTGDGTESDPYQSVPVSHQQMAIDSGKAFIHSDRHTIASNGTLSYLIKTPANPAHVELIEFTIETTSSPVYFDLFEGAVVTANGATETLRNLNRRSTTAAATELYLSPTYSAGAEGNIIWEQLTPNAKNVGSTITDGTRIVLKPSYNYLLKMQNVSGASTVVAIKIIIGED